MKPQIEQKVGIKRYFPLPGVVVHACNPLLGRLRLEDCCELEPICPPQRVLASQDYFPRLCQHKTDNQQHTQGSGAGCWYSG